MKAKELATILLEHPEKEVVVSVHNEYDEDCEITNYFDNRVIRIESASAENNLLYLFEADEKEDPSEVR
jgi:hypothetical protein